MNLQNRIDRLERVAAPTFDLTLLTDAELLTLESCYTDAGEVIEEHITPELEAALERAALGRAS
jgi:hypothetical protein